MNWMHKLYVYRIIHRTDDRFLVRRKFLGLPFSTNQYLEDSVYWDSKQSPDPFWWNLPERVTKHCVFDTAMAAKTALKRYLDLCNEQGVDKTPKVKKVYSASDPEFLAIAAQERLSGRSK